MVDLDEFESQFRAAVKERPVFERPSVRSILVISDLDRAAADALEARLQQFLKVLEPDVQSWRTLDRDQYSGVKEMLAQVEQTYPDLIVSYRHLFEDDKDLPHSLGTYADMLIQAVSTPVLLLPNPHRTPPTDKLTATDRVVVLADNIVGDQRLVNWGLRFVTSDGHLHLVNVEDDQTLNRYAEIISKIPDLDTETASRSIERQLLHEAEDFLSAWAKSIHVDFERISVDPLVRLGHGARTYMDIAREADAQLVVFNTIKEGQLAMRGVAYALAVEMLDTPLLML